MATDEATREFSDMAKEMGDKIVSLTLKEAKELSDYLEMNLRVDPGVLRDLKPAELSTIALRYQSQKIRLLSDLSRHIHNKAEKEGSHA